MHTLFVDIVQHILVIREKGFTLLPILTQSWNRSGGTMWCWYRDRPLSSGQFSSVPWPIGSWGILLRSFLQEAHVSSSGMGRDVCDLVYPALPLLTTASPTLRGALKDGFWRDSRDVWHSRTMQFSASIFACFGFDHHAVCFLLTGGKHDDDLIWFQR